MAKTKPQLIEEAEELGIALEGNESVPKLNELISEAKNRITPEGDDAPAEGGEEPEDENEDEPRISSEETEPEAPKGVSEGGDYLRQYQYRKQTKFGSKESDPRPDSKAATMKAKLLKQRRVRVLVPRRDGESKNIPQSVTINGYRLDFPKGVYVEVPEQIADMITESFNQTQEAIQTREIAGNSDKEAALRG